MRRKQRKSDCPVHFALEAFGDAWSLLIIRDLMFKERSRYGDFLRAGEGIATNVLADRLTRLEQDGIVRREGEGGRGSTTEYRLTAKGVDLLPVLLEIIAWSARYDQKTAADRAFVRRFHADRPGLEAEIRARLTRLRTRPHPRHTEKET
jgi:DNA-binding HxlR family transcriptional regulator